MEFVLCNCLTKTPTPKYHKHNCPVWMEDRILKLEESVKDALRVAEYPPQDKEIIRILKKLL